MSLSKIRIAPHLRILIADTDEAYGASLRLKLKRLGFRCVDQTSIPAATLHHMAETAYDIVMVEVAAAYQPVWDTIEKAGVGETLFVGMSLDRSGEDWVDAIRQGANAILMKAFYVHLLQPVLEHMLASPAAHRCRLVQFPQPEAIDPFESRPRRRNDSRDGRDI